MFPVWPHSIAEAIILGGFDYARVRLNEIRSTALEDVERARSLWAEEDTLSSRYTYLRKELSTDRSLTPAQARQNFKELANLKTKMTDLSYRSATILNKANVYLEVVKLLEQYIESMKTVAAGSSANAKNTEGNTVSGKRGSEETQVSSKGSTSLSKKQKSVKWLKEEALLL